MNIIEYKVLNKLLILDLKNLREKNYKDTIIEENEFFEKINEND